MVSFVSRTALVILLSALALLLPSTVHCHSHERESDSYSHSEDEIEEIRPAQHLDSAGQVWNIDEYHDHHTRQASLPDSDEFFEGDIKLSSSLRYHTDEQTGHRRLQVSPQKWDQDPVNGYYRIYIYIDDKFSSVEETRIIDAVKLLQWSGKVIKFKVLSSKPSNKRFLHIKKDTKCWSYLGMHESASQWNGQPLGMTSGCVHTGKIHHLFMHMLGFMHEQNRFDRDAYVSIFYDNIDTNAYQHFAKVEGYETYGLPYDYKSCTHFDEHAFSTSGWRQTIQSKTNTPIQDLNRASWFDFVRVRLAYQCINPYTKESISRTFDEYNQEKCTHNCQCWKNSGGCKNDDQNCANSLSCIKGVCTPP